MLNGNNDSLRGYYTSNQKLACSVIYLQIINTFLKFSICLFSVLSKELKNSKELKILKI